MKSKLTEIMLAGFFTIIGVLLGTTLNDALSKYQWRTETRFAVYSELSSLLIKHIVLWDAQISTSESAGVSFTFDLDIPNSDVIEFKKLIGKSLLTASPKLVEELKRLHSLLDLVIMTDLKIDNDWLNSVNTRKEFHLTSVHIIELMQTELQ